MESDYYLHNFHVKKGQGLTCTMRSYREAFGISWNEDDDLDEESNSSSPTHFHAGGKTDTRQSSSRRDLSRDTRTGRGNEESRRVLRVRNRCEAQKKRLSTWWKHALQANLQQRMWMQLGKSQTEELLAPRFERVYEPEKLGQFDRFFSRAWATPVRRSHAAQHTEGAEEGDARDLLRRFSDAEPQRRVPDESKSPESSANKVQLGRFIDTYGYEPRSETSLRRFSEYHAKLTKVSSTSGYIGDLTSVDSSVPREYLNYVSSTTNEPDKPQRYRPETVQEFKTCLQDYTLESDDVGGIQKVRLPYG